MSEEEREIDVELDVSTVVKLKFLTYFAQVAALRGEPFFLFLVSVI
jgi:hypothetical protein